MKRVVQTFHPFVLVLPSHSSTKTLLHSIPVCKYKCRTTVRPTSAPAVPAEMIYHGLKSHGCCIFGRTRFAQPIHTVTDEWKFREINHREQRHILTSHSPFSNWKTAYFKHCCSLGEPEGDLAWHTALQLTRQGRTRGYGCWRRSDTWCDCAAGWTLPWWETCSGYSQRGRSSLLGEDWRKSWTDGWS